MASRQIGQILVRNSALFLCDMQEKFRPTIRYFPEIVEVASRMLKAARILKMPLIVTTEQYPKGLGPTVPELGIDRETDNVVAKNCFTMCTADVGQRLADAATRSVILCGIETQACIQQTALELLDKGLDVHVVADACSSRSMVDRFYALERMRQSGAFVTTSEALLLQLLGGSDHPSFREVQKLIQTSAPDSGLLSKM